MHFDGNKNENDQGIVKSFVTDVTQAIQKDIKYITGIK
jgi:hypothetical protein